MHSPLRPLALAIALLAPATSAFGLEKSQCASKELNPQVQQVTCTLPAGAQRFRFRADFAGSHDDTKLSLAPTLGGKPTACGSGSKTDLFAEDGEVSLTCRVDVSADAPRQLVVDLNIHHAQYVDFAIVKD